jgi:hypothetical protein
MVMRCAINRLVLFHTMRHRFTNLTGRAAMAAALRCSRVGHKGTRLGNAAVLRQAVCCCYSPNTLPGCSGARVWDVAKEKIWLPSPAQCAS